MTSRETPDEQRIALSLQQPWAELILRGIKSIEIRKTPTKIRGRIYLYAGKQFSALPCASDALTAYNLDVRELPRGCLVGTVNLIDCRASRPEDAPLACVPAKLLERTSSWLLEDAERCPQLWPAHYLPYGPWFYPFRRRSSSLSDRASI